MGARPLVSLLSDFGGRDAFVGMMKGVILGICPDASLVDLSHEVPPYDILGGSFWLRAAAAAFPAGAIHLAVVDPGVGGGRRPILAEIDGQFFVAPDNGLLSWPLESAGGWRLRHLTAREYWRHPVSASFHGRDIFAPVAGHLAAGVEPARFGPEIDDPVRLEIPRPSLDAGGTLHGTVVWVDRFGNCVTNVTDGHLKSLACGGAQNLLVRVGGRALGPLVDHFARAKPGESGAVVGSTGHLELFCNRGNLAQQWGLGPGDAVVLRAVRGG